MHGLAKTANNNSKGTDNRKVYNYLKDNYPKKVLDWVNDVKWELKKRVPLDKIKMARRPGGARNQDKVEGIANAIKNNKPMEPVVLVRVPNGDIKIADGFHRTLAFKRAGRKTISAWIADSEKDTGPWDKEMHENKLNVGKTAFEVGLAGMAK